MLPTKNNLFALLKVRPGVASDNGRVEKVFLDDIGVSVIFLTAANNPLITFGKLFRFFSFLFRFFYYLCKEFTRMRVQTLN